MAYPTNAQIEAAVPATGEPVRSLTQQVLKDIVGNVATAADYGPIKLGAAAVQTVAPGAVTTTAARTYSVQLTANGGAVVNVPWVNTTYTVATISAPGLMSAADKTKLDGLPVGGGTVTPTAAPVITIGDPVDDENVQASFDALIAALKTAGVLT